MSIKDLDYQEKIIIPTQQLYEQLSEKANELFTQTKELAVDIHGKVADVALEFYEHPIETASHWQIEVVEKSNALYSAFNDTLVPRVKEDYEQLIVTLIDYGIQSRESLQVFIDNPEQITVATFSGFNQALSTYFDKTLDVSSAVLNDLSSKADEIISLLIEQPMDTVENFYYQVLTTLLNSYFEIVSSALGFI